MFFIITITSVSSAILVAGSILIHKFWPLTDRQPATDRWLGFQAVWPVASSINRRLSWTLCQAEFLWGERKEKWARERNLLWPLFFFFIKNNYWSSPRVAAKTLHYFLLNFVFPFLLAASERSLKSKNNETAVVIAELFRLAAWKPEKRVCKQRYPSVVTVLGLGPPRKRSKKCPKEAGDWNTSCCSDLWLAHRAGSPASSANRVIKPHRKPKMSLERGLPKRNSVFVATDGWLLVY